MAPATGLDADVIDSRTWCSENGTVPGFVLASSAIHRRFVDRTSSS